MNNLEQWIDATISSDGMSDEDLMIRIKESYQRSLEANIEHHTLLADVLREEGEIKSAKRHALLADVYKKLLE